jgi:uncharacterized protein YndB with AHSA1/START domain
MTDTLPFRLDRTITIQAPPERVFRFFTDTERWAKWWGAGSTIEPRPGGRIYIKHPGGIESSGEVIEVDAPRRLVFTYGFVAGTPIPPGGSRVTIALAGSARGTLLTLTHDVPTEAARDEHEQGWRFQLSLFANVVSNEITAHAAQYIDLWYAAWAETDAIARRKMLEEVAIPDVRMQDRFSALEGIDDVLPHIAASQRFMPGLRMRRAGDVRACQGMVLSDWVVEKLTGDAVGKGTNVFVLGPTGRIEWVTGFWSG